MEECPIFQHKVVEEVKMTCPDHGSFIIREKIIEIKCEKDESIKKSESNFFFGSGLG